MSNARHTIRVHGTDLGLNDAVVCAFATYETVATVAVIGWIRRIRVYDEFTGRPVQSPVENHGCGSSTMNDPEFWIEDHRTGELCGPIKRHEIQTIAQIDGPWMSPDEMAEMS
jgi:hypothetical protein